MKQVEKLYNSLLEDGDLLLVAEGMTGEWSKDKKAFKEYYDMQMNYLKDIEIGEDTIEEVYE